jgi:phosphate transport system substrate-binding protein
MKTTIVILTVAAFIAGGPVWAGPPASLEETLEGTITLSGAWALYPMVVRWSEEFGKLHPGVRIDIGAGGAGKGMADALADIVDLGMVSRDIHPAEIERGAWWVSVTKDAVVPVTSAENPVLEALMARGVDRDTFRGIWMIGDVTTWGQVIGDDTGHVVRAYTRSDACGAAQTWAKYLGGAQEELVGVGVYGDPGLADAVRKDALGIGFNNINYVYDAKTRRPMAGLAIVPIDLNADGLVGPDERFYANRDGIVAAIASGVYPSPPARDLHLVSKGVPKSRLVVAFLEWVLTEGQAYVTEAGYIGLGEERLAAELGKLSDGKQAGRE